MKKTEFKCEACGKIYEKGRSDEEVIEETKRLWDKSLLENTSIICDDCFKKGIGKFN